MRRLLVCLLLVGVVGCGKSQSTANLTACPDCEKEVSKRATACPHCGAPLTEQASSPEPARPEVSRPGSGQSRQSGNAQPPTVDKTTVNSIGMKLTLIPAGEFQMSSLESEPGRNGEKPQHLVKITKPFYLGVYEVTQQQYEKVMGARPWQGKGYVKEGADYPASYMSHNDAVDFCRRLSKQEGVEYRLPTEAEWEYACRAGTTTSYSFGDDESQLGQYAWYRQNAWDVGDKYAHRVGQKLPNRWGLYDMHGNVREWSQGWYATYFSEKVVSDPLGPVQGRYPVLRGGSFSLHSSNVRSASRVNYPPDSRLNPSGFRAARTYNAAP